jgi:hypothetical protein
VSIEPSVYRVETPPRPGSLQAVGTELDKPVMALPAGPTPGATQFVRHSPLPLFSVAVKLYLNSGRLHIPRTQEGQYVINALEAGPIPVLFGWGHDEVVKPDEPVLFSGTVTNWDTHKAKTDSTRLCYTLFPIPFPTNSRFRISVPGGPLSVTSLVDIEEQHVSLQASHSFRPLTLVLTYTQQLVMKLYPIIPGI